MAVRDNEIWSCGLLHTKRLSDMGNDKASGRLLGRCMKCFTGAVIKDEGVGGVQYSRILVQ